MALNPNKDVEAIRISPQAGARNIAVPPATQEFRVSKAVKFQGDRRSQANKRTMRFLAQLSADVLAIVFAILLAGGLAWSIDTFLLHIGYQAFEDQDLQRRIVIWAFLTAFICSWFGITGAYTTRRPLQDEVKQILATVIAVLVFDGFIEFVVKEQFSRLWILLVWPMAAITLPTARVILRKSLDASGVWRIGAAVMGTGSHYASVERSLVSDYYIGYFVAYFSKLPDSTLQSASKIAEYLKSDMQLRNAEIALLVPSEAEMVHLGKTIDALNFNLTPYVLIPPIQRLSFAGLSIQSMLSSDAILLTSRNGLMSPGRQAVKRAFDIAASAALILFLLPLMIVLSLVVASDGGAPIFGHERIGRNGKHFRCLKFRSMAKNADRILAELLATDPDIAREWSRNFKLTKDPRITRVGRFLRKSSLDELPQLLNVLRGQMSLVGPRPVVAEELTRYYGDDAFYYRLVRPGMTGLWQVSGRSETTYERRVFLDAWYVRNWSLWTDIVICSTTLPSVIAKQGAK